MKQTGKNTQTERSCYPKWHVNVFGRVTGTRKDPINGCKDQINFADAEGTTVLWGNNDMEVQVQL
jgi:hypothetical protein